MVLVILALGLPSSANAATGTLSPVGCISTAAIPGCSEQPGLELPSGLAVSPDGNSLYVANGEHGISHFSRDPATGLVVYQGCTGTQQSGCAATELTGSVYALALSPDGKSVYALAGEGVVHFSRDLASGQLTVEGCVAPKEPEPTACSRRALGLIAAQDLAVSPDGRSLYVVSDEPASVPGDSALVHLERNQETGELRPINDCFQPKGFQGPCPNTARGLWQPTEVALSPDARSLYVTGQDESTLLHFRRNRRTGRLSSTGCIEDARGLYNSCRRDAAGLDGAAALAVSPDSRSVYVVGFLALTSFRRDEDTGRLRPTGCVADTEGGTFQTHGLCKRTAPAIGFGSAGSLLVSPDANSLYVADHQSGAIGMFGRARSSKLTSLGCIVETGHFTPCQAAMDGLDDAASVTISPDGRYVYVTSNGEHTQALSILARS